VKANSVSATKHRLFFCCFKLLRLGTIAVSKDCGCLTLHALPVPGEPVVDVRAAVLTLLE